MADKKKKTIQSLNSLFTIIIVIIIFILFAIAVLYPIYYLSKKYNSYYSIAVSAIAVIFIIYLLVRQTINIWKKYKKINLLVLNIFTHILFPIILLASILFMELVSVRIFFEIFAYYTALFAVAVANLVFLTALYFSFKAIGKIKKYLRSKDLSLN